jgi:hypothetical protein
MHPYIEFLAGNGLLTWLWAYFSGCWYVWLLSSYYQAKLITFEEVRWNVVAICSGLLVGFPCYILVSEALVFCVFQLYIEYKLWRMGL